MAAPPVGGWSTGAPIVKPVENKIGSVSFQGVKRQVAEVPSKDNRKKDQVPAPEKKKILAPQKLARDTPKSQKVAPPSLSPDRRSISGKSVSGQAVNAPLLEKAVSAKKGGDEVTLSQQAIQSQKGSDSPDKVGKKGDAAKTETKSGVQAVDDTLGKPLDWGRIDKLLSELNKVNKRSK